MSSNVATWQADARRAFDWIATLYEQAQTAWEDADAFFNEDGWTTQLGSGLGGVAMSGADLRKWPFVYLKVMGAYREEPKQAAPGNAAFFGFLFHDTKRSGPVCVAGTLSWTNGEVNCDHWLLLAAMGCDVNDYYAKMFDIVDGPIRHAKPTPKGGKNRPGMGDVRWFEVPLGAITSADLLRRLVSAAEAMVDGDDAQAKDLAGQLAPVTP